MEKLLRIKVNKSDMKKAQVMDFTVIIEQDEEGWYIASVPDIPGCYTQGKTVSQVLERVKEAIEVCLEAEPNEYRPLKFIGVQRVLVSQ